MNPELQPETKRLLEQGNDLMKRFNEQNPTIISASNLNKNTQPYSLPTAPTQPTTGNLAQATNSSIANAVTTATLDRPTNPAKEQASSLLSKLISNQQNQASEVNKINQDEQVFQKKQAATTLKNDLDQFDKQYRDEVEAIKKNSQGKFGGAVEQDLRKAEERYQNVRANKVLSYNSAIGDYQGASEIAQSKIAALKEQNAQELNLYKLAVDAVNNDLTESEKLVAQANIQEKQQKAKTLEDAYASAVQVGLDNGANQNYFNALDTAKESGNVSAIASTISSYGYKSLDQQLQQAQLQKVYQDLQIGPKKTDTQLKASGFAQRMIEAGQIVDSIGSKFAGVESYAGQVLPNILKSEDRQKFEQAQRNFINAVLRRESGAVISEEEFANARKQYFPQPGDSVGVLEQKRQNRLTSTNSLLNESGVEQIPYIPETEQTRVVNGQTYIKVEGGWKLQK